MADKNDLKRLLLRAALARQKRPTETQLDQATEQLSKKASVTKEGLRILGESVARDPDLFDACDPDTANDILGDLRK